MTHATALFTMGHCPLTSVNLMLLQNGTVPVPPAVHKHNIFFVTLPQRGFRTNQCQNGRVHDTQRVRYRLDGTRVVCVGMFPWCLSWGILFHKKKLVGRGLATTSPHDVCAEKSSWCPTNKVLSTYIHMGGFVYMYGALLCFLGFSVARALSTDCDDECRPSTGPCEGKGQGHVQV